MLLTQNLKFKVLKKLLPKFVRPFRVLDPTRSQAYRLALPNQYERIHNVFHVSLLEPWTPYSVNHSKEFLTIPDLEDESDKWEVQDIVGDQRYKQQSYFLVKQKGWLSEYNQWVLEKDISASDIIAKYRRTRSTKKKKKCTSI